MDLAAYQRFLESKVTLGRTCGFEVDLETINPDLKPFTRVSVQWLLRGGRRALFSRFGLHKTVTQIEYMRQLGIHRPGTPRLIVAPLGVRAEFFEDAQRFFRGDCAVDLRFVQRTAEIDDDRPLWLTNYESVREGKLVPEGFRVSLDEASVLRGFGGSKTFREFMGLFETSELERCVATATPSPQEYIELLAYAAFLGIMDVGQAKTRFFKRNSEKADELTLRPGAEHEFWLWVASWALFVQRPSDLGFSDEGYTLPPLQVRWHEVPTDHSGAGAERDGQVRMFRNAALGVVDASREKRDSLAARIAKLQDIRAEDPEAHRVIWHDLEAERLAIEKAVPNVVTVYGSQDLEEREAAVRGFKDGSIKELAAKPVMLGSGTNFQRHCHRAVYLGIGFKFNDFIQSVYRLQRFGQERAVIIDLIFTSAERDIRDLLERRWAQHDEQGRIMSDIIRQYGLNNASMAAALQRAIGVEREEASGTGWRMVHNDCVAETAAMADNSVDLMITSIPFSTQYEYSANYNDFGHNLDDQRFWDQMDFLIPELLRVLKPGRVAAVHVKDRIVPGGINGLGFQTISAFSDDTRRRFEAHGFAVLARKIVVTDVVRENNQTYRLGWSEQCKDGTKMGAGMPEYVFVFRKPPSDRGDGYADEPVRKAKPDVFVEGNTGATQPFAKGKRPVPGTGYSRGRWQLDAHAVTFTNGEGLPVLPRELVDLVKAGLRNRKDLSPVYQGWKRWLEDHFYDFDLHVAFAEELDRNGLLPPDFMLIPPHAEHPDVWTDVARMRTLNGAQQAKGREMHLCPLQFDIVDRLIVQHSQPGELVMDPFGGLGTVPLRALQLGRRGLGVELSRKYWSDALYHLRAAEAERAVPDLFGPLATKAEAA